MQTRISPHANLGEARAVALEAVCEVLRRGDVVALPTETVYGLAGML
jgi:tRNA A37 threonylcarbamoyladenosine synthetase subunit TsaC/SUA5/YrdC